MRCWLLVLLLIVGQAVAQELKIAGLQLEGCRVTDPQKVLAAIGFQPGMPYDAERLQKALMDLGLFESVTLETTETTQGVQVTAKVRERTYPVPTTEAAARALNPIAVARRWLSSQQKPSLPLSEGEKGISLGVFRFNTTLEIDKTLFFVGDNAWIQKALKAADDKTARERLIAQLRQHLQKTPDDAWARFALAYLLMVQGHHDEADQQISTLLARQPNFHPVYVLRLFSAFLRLAAFLEDRMRKRVAEVLLSSDFPLPPPDPASPGIVRWAIDEGVTHFRRLPDKAFTRDTLLAATLFFNNAVTGEFFLLFFWELSESQKDEEETHTQASWERFAARFSDYLADYLRLSRLAERFAEDLTVQKAMADGWQSSLTFHASAFLILSAVTKTFDAPQQTIDALITAFRTQLRLMRPYLERHRWHLERLTVKNSPYRPDALNDLAKCLALLGDFSAAQKVMDTALRETGKLESETLTEVIGLHAFSEGNRLTPTLVARYVAWLDGLERQRPLPGSVALWLSYWRLWLAAKGDTEAMWEKVPEAERREALNRLRRSAQRFPSNAESWWALGMMALALNDVPTASDALTKASELDPEKAAYRYALGLTALAQGDLQWAMELLKAMETNP
jgi:tetratricopeptide (TPR) repeat protein